MRSKMFSIIKPFTSRENGLIIAEIHDLLQHEMNIGQPIRFAYFIFNKSQDEKPVIYSNYPKDWVEKYMKNELYKQDPVLLVASQKIMSFPWHKNYFKKTKRQKSNIFIQSSEYNITRGYTFPLHDYENNLAMLSLYTESDPDLLMKCISDHEDRLYLLFLSIHNRFLAEKTQQTNKLHAKVEKRLTSREIEALHWASIGKTYREIAIIMGITESTVKFHIGNLIVKLDVINAKHAIKKATDLHLLNFNE